MKHKLTVPEKQVLAFAWLLLKTNGRSHHEAARMVGQPAATLWRWQRNHLWPAYPEPQPSDQMQAAVKILKQRLK